MSVLFPPLTAALKITGRVKEEGSSEVKFGFQGVKEEGRGDCLVDFPGREVILACLHCAPFLLQWHLISLVFFSFLPACLFRVQAVQGLYEKKKSST